MTYDQGTRLYQNGTEERDAKALPVMWTCKSTKPGMMTHPEASRTVRFAETRFRAAASDVLSKPTTCIRRAHLGSHNILMHACHFERDCKWNIPLARARLPVQSKQQATELSRVQVIQGARNRMKAKRQNDAAALGVGICLPECRPAAHSSRPLS